jgi:hypothetical protein
MTERMTSIALALAEQRNLLAEAEIRLWQLARDAEARQLALTPADGWPGKNEEQRRAAREQAWSSDPALGQIAAEVERLEPAVLRARAGIAALEDERRALEWQVRARLVAALEGAGVRPNGHAPPETAGFDDALQHAAEGEALEDALPF